MRVRKSFNNARDASGLFPDRMDSISLLIFTIPVNASGGKSSISATRSHGLRTGLNMYERSV
jgi:hypothetical protein